MEDCIFCKIVKGEVPAIKVYEDEWTIGILDLFPNTPGQCLIISKSHETPDFSEADPEMIHHYMDAAQSLAKKIKKGMGVQRVGIIIEGMAVNHFHIKVYPFHGDLKTDHSKFPRVWFDNYPGYMTSLTGRMANQKELEEIGKKIRES